MEPWERGCSIYRRETAAKAVSWYQKLNTTLVLEFSEQEMGLSLLTFICKQTLLCLATINDRVINKL